MQRGKRTSNLSGRPRRGGKLPTAIPKACEAVVPADIEARLDLVALLKEANRIGRKTEFQ